MLANYLSTNTQFKNIKLNRPINKGQGWQGRLCWNTPFICTYNPEKLVVNKNNLNYLVISKMKNYLVVGGGGFIGHLIKKLLDTGAKVRAVDIKPSEFWFQRFEEVEIFPGHD